MHFVIRGYHPLWPDFPDCSTIHEFLTPGISPTSPTTPDTTEIVQVWAVPLSLAATDGITIVFSSWGYLDVSVPPVRPA